MKWLPTLLAGMSIGFVLTTLCGAGTSRRRAAGAATQANASPSPDIAGRPGMAELAGALAHELNQPLTAITSNAQAAREYLMSGRLEQAEIREILDDIVNDASRASDIVRGVRALIRGEAPRCVPFHIGEVITRALDLVQENARSRGATVDGMAEPSLPRVVGDPIEIQLVLLNLLVNALDAVEVSQASGARNVSVTARERDGSIRVSVRDNGCGVSDADLGNIFRPFYSSKPNGMGLGLSFSRALMERNGGRILAIRNSDQGMTFECQLRIEASASAHHPVPAAAASRLRTGSFRR